MYIAKSIMWCIIFMTSLSASAQLNMNALTNTINNSASRVVSNKGTVAKTSIIGLWRYKQPVVVFESDNLLQNAGSTMVSSTIEKEIQLKFNQAGIKTGSMQITFAPNGRFMGVIPQKNVTGTYTLNGSIITLNFLNGPQHISGITQVHNGNLEILFNSTMFLKFISAVGDYTNDDTLKTISSIIGSYKGMQTGIRLTKSK